MYCRECVQIDVLRIVAGVSLCIVEGVYRLMFSELSQGCHCVLWHVQNFFCTFHENQKAAIIYIAVLRSTLEIGVVCIVVSFIESRTPFFDCVDTHSHQVSRLATSGNVY